MRRILFYARRGAHQRPTGCNKTRKPRRRHLCTGAADYGPLFSAREKKALCRGARPQEGGGAYPHPSPPAKTNEGAMRSGETGAWTARRPRERLGTPSKDLPFTVWATPQLRDLARVGTVWYRPFTYSVLIHSRTGPRLGPPCAPAPPRTPPPPHGHARPSCARKCLGSWRAWRGP